MLISTYRRCAVRLFWLGKQMGDDNKLYSELNNEFFSLWVLVAQCKDVVLKARERDYARFGISNERRSILFTIFDCGGQSTPTEIARRLFREVHSVSEMLVRMEKDGLITKRKANGQNKVEVRLTPKGLDVFEQSLHSETDKRVFSVLDEDERKLFASLLMKVRKKALDEIGWESWNGN